MSDSCGDDVSSASYAVRLHPMAINDITRERIRLSEISGETVGAEWEALLMRTIAGLAYKAPFLPIADESSLFPLPVRILRYRRRRGAPVYRVLLTVKENGDGPRAIVLAVRHGAKAPMTQEEVDALRL